MSSTSFGTKKRPAGKKYRDGTLGKALTDLYTDVEDAFVALQAVVATKAPDVSSLQLGTETKTTAAALSATIPVSFLNNTTSNVAFTLPVATTAGQVKFVSKNAGDGTHTSTITAGATILPAADIVLKAVGDCAEFIFDGTHWVHKGGQVTA